jgi:hypothetical protein
MRTIVRTWLVAAVSFASPDSGTATEAWSLPNDVRSVLAARCVDCHGGDAAEGDVRLDDLASLDLDARIALLNKTQEQVFLGHMPPADEEQPTDAERSRLVEWMSHELGKHKASTLEQKLAKPDYGNYVDHDKLFSGDYARLPGFTYDRRWLISEYIFNASFQRLLGNVSRAKRNGMVVTVVGDNRFPTLGLANPFLLPTVSGVRYYANEDLTGGHLSSMLTNAQKVSEYITTDPVKRRNVKYLPAIGAILALEEKHLAMLAARRAFLETFIAKLCDEIYGRDNESFLPPFTPVVLNADKPLEKDGKSKKAPFGVAQNLLKELDGDATVYRLLLDPAFAGMSDEAFRDHCERIWFFYGDHERTIQGRMTILRDYLPELRDHVAKNAGKTKPVDPKPLVDAEMDVVRASIKEHREKGDFYRNIIDKCVEAWEREFEEERVAAGPPSDELLSDLIEELSVQILERPPTESEAAEYLGLARAYVSKLGKLKAIQKLIQTFILSSDFAYRQEFGAGEADEHGRRMLSPRDASYAIAYALTDQSPDAELAEAAATGRLVTREDYRREVLRILNRRDIVTLIDPFLADASYQDNTTTLPIRTLRFFREFFGYPGALAIFKDEKRFGADRLTDATARLVNEADRLVEHILERDEHVFEELLTSDAFYVYHDGDNDRMQAASDRIKRIDAYFKDLDWRNFKNEDLLAHADFLREVKMRMVDPDNLAAKNRQGTSLQLFKMSMESIIARLDKGQKEAAPFDFYRGYGYDFMVGYNVAKFYDIALDDWDYATIQPAPVAHRKGLLTHPAWLIAHAKNTENDPVQRGKWVREKLLAGTIPDVPISVDASIPEDHHRTLRDRLAEATETAYCWKCHERMNPLGYAFECYDDFGRFRTEEALEYPDMLVTKRPDTWTLLTDTRDLYKTRPVDARGYLRGTGEESLDGDVTDAIDLADRLGRSRRVRQSIIRHAFRYFMGRNEVLSDSKTLIDAEQAYTESGGSFDAVIVSLLTSDSFIFRKPIED